jgi:hypothetical protein
VVSTNQRNGNDIGWVSITLSKDSFYIRRFIKDGIGGIGEEGNTMFPYERTSKRYPKEKKFIPTSPRREESRKKEHCLGEKGREQKASGLVYNL